MADGSLPHEAVQGIPEQVPQVPSHKAESVDAALAEGRMDRLQEAVHTAADVAAKELAAMSQAAQIADDPEAAAANQEIAQADLAARQQLDAAKAEASQELEQTEQVAVSPKVDVAGALEGDSVKTVEQSVLPVGEQIKKIDGLAEQAKSRMHELYQTLMKMKASGGELDEKELEVYKEMVDNDAVLNGFVEAMQLEFQNDQNEGSVRARAAQYASEFALGARSQLAYAEAIASRPKQEPVPNRPAPQPGQPPEAKRAAERPRPASSTESVDAKPVDQTRLGREQAVFQRLKRIDALVDQVSQSPDMDVARLMALREQVDVLHAENVKDWDELKEVGGPQNEALNDLQSHMVDVMQALDAVLAEQGGPMQTRHVERLSRLRKQGGGDVQTLETYFAEEETKQKEAAHEKDMEARRVVFEELAGQVDQLFSSFKASNMQAGPDEIRTLRKLMAKTHPDTHPNDEGVARLYNVLSRLKMAFEGDANSWKNPRGGSLEADFLALKKELGVKGEEPSQTEEEIAATAQATESPIPQPQTNGEEGPNPVPDEAAYAERRIGAMESLLGKKIRKVEANFEEVLASGDDKKIEAAFGLLQDVYKKRMVEVTKDINEYYKTPAAKRTPRSEKNAALMLYEEELLGAQMDAHTQKVELARLEREKTVIDAEVVSLQQQLEAAGRIDAGLLLPPRPSLNAVPNPDAAATMPAASNAEALAASLQAALGKQADLAAKIGLGTAALATIYAGIDRIVSLHAKAQKELEAMPKDAKVKEGKIEMIYKDAENDNAYGNNDSRVQSDAFDLSGRPGSGEKGGSKSDGWFEKIGDVVAEAMHGDESSIQGAKQLLNQVGRAVTSNKKAA